MPQSTIKKLTQAALKTALDRAAKSDAQLSEGIRLVGYPEPRSRPLGFPALLEIFANQQISKEAAAAILGRLEDLLGQVTVENFMSESDEALRATGLSRPKIAYARGAAEAILTGTIALEQFPELPDEEVIDALTGLKGIGRWSAEIYCMFSLHRPDLFPGEDIALQEAMKRLKGLQERPKPKYARELAEAWSPHRTAVSLFLWKYYRGAPSALS